MELYQFLHILQYILCILQHPVDFSKPRPFRIDLAHETTHVYKFSCLVPKMYARSLFLSLNPWTIGGGCYNSRELDGWRGRL